MSLTDHPQGLQLAEERISLPFPTPGGGIFSKSRNGSPYRS